MNNSFSHVYNNHTIKIKIHWRVYRTENKKFLRTVRNLPEISVKIVHRTEQVIQTKRPEWCPIDSTGEQIIQAERPERCGLKGNVSKLKMINNSPITLYLWHSRLYYNTARQTCLKDGRTAYFFRVF